MHTTKCMVKNGSDSTTRIYVVPCAEELIFHVEQGFLQVSGGGTGGEVPDPEDGGDD